MSGRTNDCLKAKRSAPAVVLNPHEARALLRLSRTLHTLVDPAGRKRALLEGACQLVGADRGLSVVTHIDARTGRRTLMAALTVGDRARVNPAAPPERPATGIPTGSGAADADALRAWAGLGRCVESILPLRGVHLVAWLAAGRAEGGPAFPPRARALLDLLHEECAWVYSPDLLLATPDALTLSPRERQVLQHLLSGEGEKQIAAHLGGSPNTIHHHVKAIYRRLGVSSRAELLARWVGERAAE